MLVSVLMRERTHFSQLAFRGVSLLIVIVATVRSKLRPALISFSAF